MRHPSPAGQKSRFWRGAGWSAWGVCLGWLGFGWLWNHDPASQDAHDGWLAFAALCSQAFAVHFGVFVLLLALTALAVGARRLAMACSLLLLPTLGSMVHGFMPRTAASPDAHEEGLTVLSANMLFGQDRLAELLPQIEECDADLVLLQEYEAGDSESEARLRMWYPYFASWPREEAFGQAVFSRHPFVQQPRLVRGPEGTLIPAAACIVEVRGRAVAVWNVHPLPPVGPERTLGQRAMVCWIADRVTEMMGEPDGAEGLIIAGDFNAPYRTNHLRELRHAGLREAHDEVGLGAGATWPRVGWERHFPGIRLDHIMFAGVLEPVWAEVGVDYGSDHRPVIARFVWPGVEP